MSARIATHLTTTAGLGSPAAPARETLWTVMRRVWITVTTRNQLAELDERMLHDLGLSKADVSREMARAPWDTAPVRRGDRPL
jgi:uncharacterized protein YjiS (DUF1127 family)